MTTPTLFHYAGCGTCKKALAFLTARGLAFARVDLVATPPDLTTLARLWRTSGLPLERFFNTSGESYRAGSFKDRLPTMSETDKLEALARDGKLIKRPLLDLGVRVLVGFKEPDWDAAFTA